MASEDMSQKAYDDAYKILLDVAETIAERKFNVKEYLALYSVVDKWAYGSRYEGKEDEIIEDHIEGAAELASYNKQRAIKEVMIGLRRVLGNQPGSGF